MKTDMTTTSVTVPSSATDSTKLASLLALAAGAIAMPQTSNADIVYVDLNSAPAEVGFLGGTSFFDLTLPGSAGFRFQRFEQSVTTSTTFGSTTMLFRGVKGTDLFGSASVRIQFSQQGPNRFAVPLQYGAAWNPAAPLYYTAIVGVANTSVRNPNAGYNRQFLAFRFEDSTASFGYRYGWIEVSLGITTVNPFGNPTTGGPNLIIYGYAYDDAGSFITMGQKGAVPEPSSAAMLVIGALALGAPGLRKWRQNRTVDKS